MKFLGDRLGERSLKTIIISGSKIFVGMSSLLAFMILSRTMETEEYSNFRQFLLLGGLMTQFAVFGAPQAVIYFLPNQHQNIKKYICIPLILNALVLSAICVAFLLFYSQIEDFYSDYSILDHSYSLFLWVWAFGVFQILASSLIGLQRPILAAFFNLSYALTVLTSILILSYNEFSSIYSVYPFVASFLSIILSLFLIFSIKESINIQGITKDIKIYIKFTFPLFCSQFVTLFGTKAAAIIVVPFLTISEYAIYSNGSFDIPLAGIVVTSALAVITPEFVKFYNNNNKGSALNLWKRAAVKCSLVIFPAFIFLFYVAKDFMAVLFTEKYIESNITFRCFLLLMPIKIIYFAIIFITAEKSKWLLLRGILTATFSVLLTLIICKYFNPMYAPLGIVCAHYFVDTPYNIFWFKKITQEPFLNYFPISQLMQIMMIALIALAPIFLLDFLNLKLFLGFILKAVTFYCLYFILLKLINIKNV